MLVRFKQAAEAVIDGIRKWVHAGAVGEIHEDHFHPDVHEALDPPTAEAAAPADSAPSQEDASEATPEAGSQ